MLRVRRAGACWLSNCSTHAAVARCPPSRSLWDFIRRHVSLAMAASSLDGSHPAHHGANETRTLFVARAELLHALCDGPLDVGEAARGVDAAVLVQTLG